MYVKARFTGKAGSTAGVVLSATDAKRLSVSALSRFFPYNEALKMERLEISPEFDSWESAFAWEF